MKKKWLEILFYLEDIFFFFCLFAQQLTRVAILSLSPRSGFVIEDLKKKKKKRLYGSRKRKRRNGNKSLEILKSVKAYFPSSKKNIHNTQEKRKGKVLGYFKGNMTSHCYNLSPADLVHRITLL